MRTPSMGWRVVFVPNSSPQIEEKQMTDLVYICVVQTTSLTPTTNLHRLQTLQYRVALLNLSKPQAFNPQLLLILFIQRLLASH